MNRRLIQKISTVLIEKNNYLNLSLKLKFTNIIYMWMNIYIKFVLIKYTYNLKNITQNMLKF